MMDYIIIGLLIIIIILVIVAIMKNVNEGKITERLGNLESNTIKGLSSFQIDIMKTMNDNFNGLNDRMEKKLSQINDKVNERLDDNFAKTNKTFTNILERLSKIDEAQKKIDTLSTDIVSLQSILTDKKSRGIFGEVNLKHNISKSSFIKSISPHTILNIPEISPTLAPSPSFLYLK